MDLNSTIPLAIAAAFLAELWNGSSVDGAGAALVARCKEASSLAGLVIACLVLLSTPANANATAAPTPSAQTPTAISWPGLEPSRQEYTTGGSEGLPQAVVRGGNRTAAPSSSATGVGGAMVKKDSFFALLAAVVGSVALLGVAGLWLICFVRERTRKRRDPHETSVEEPGRPASCKFPTAVAPSLGSFEEADGDRASGQVTSNPLYASSGRGSERPLSASARTAVGTDYDEFKDVDLEGGDGKGDYNGDNNGGRSSGGSDGLNGDASDDPSSLSDWKPTKTAVALGDEESLTAGAVEGNHTPVTVRGSGGGAFAGEIASVDREFTRNRKKVNATTEMLDTVGSAFLLRPPPCSDRGGSSWRDSPAAPGASGILSSLAVVAAGSPAPRLGRSRTVSPTSASARGDCSSDFGRPVASSRGLERGGSSRSLHGTGVTTSSSVKSRPSLERIHSDGDHPSSHRQPLSREGRTSSSSSSSSRRQRRLRLRRQREAEGTDGLGESTIPARAAERVLAAAEALAAESIIPVVRESAEVAAGLARIAAEHQGKAREVDRRVRWCRALVRVLESAGEVLGQVGQTATAHDGGAERVLLEDVRECVADVMEIVRTYKSTSGVSKVFASGLCNRRRDETEEAIDAAQQRLEVIMQVRAGNVVGTMGQPGDSGGSQRQGKTFKEILAQSKKKRRQRCSDQVEISAEEIEVMTDEVIGSGGSFGTVHLADYNGLNAAAKVVVLDADAIEDDDDDDSVSGHYRIEGPQSSRETRLRRWSEEGSLDLTESGRAGAPVSPAARVRRAEQKASLEARRRQIFLREVETMKKLRDANVVRIYGGVVSARDRLVLVMELLPAGSLRHRLKRAKRKLSERTLRRILADVCSGMAFLHAQTFVHGGFKSTNVLFDAGGRAKISDYNALLWAQHSSRLDTFLTTQGESIGVNLRWASPEILNRERATAKSDVYSFGVVLWECLTRRLPWKDLNGVDRLLLAVTGGERPIVPSDAPTDLATLTKACWAQDPAARPTFEGILSDLRQAEGGPGIGVDSRAAVGGGGSGDGGKALSTLLWPWSAWSSTTAAGEQVSEAGTPRTSTGEPTASPDHFQVLRSSVSSVRRVGGDRAGGESGGGGSLWAFASRKKPGGSVSIFPAVPKRSEEAGGNEGRTSGGGGSKLLDEPPKPDRDLPSLFRRLREEKALVGCLSSGEESSPGTQPPGIGRVVPIGRGTREDGACAW